MLIEIRASTGERLAAAETLSEACAQLVRKIENYRKIVEANHRACGKFQALQPDVSATPPEHHDMFSAGWRAAQRNAPWS